MVQESITVAARLSVARDDGRTQPHDGATAIFLLEHAVGMPVYRFQP